MHSVFSVLPSRIFFLRCSSELPETVSYSLEKSNSSLRSSDKILLSACGGNTRKTCFWLKISKSVRTLNTSVLGMAGYDYED